MALQTKIFLTDDKICQSDGAILTLCGDNTIASVGTFKYATDQSGTYTARSVVDKGYVTGLTNTLSGRVTTIEGLYLTGATNGLTLTGKRVKFGGTLCEATTITGAGFAMCFNGLGATSICSTSLLTCATGTAGIYASGVVNLSTAVAGSGMIITAPVTGAKYAADYSAGFVNESLVTKRYLTGITANGIVTANNGLRKTGVNLVLGGPLTGNTGISGAYTMGFNNSVLNLTGSTSINVSSPSIKLTQSPANGSTATDLLLVRATDGTVKTVNGGAVLGAAITGATNGLTKVGQNVKLGGTLTGVTTISQAGANCLSIINSNTGCEIFSLACGESVLASTGCGYLEVRPTLAFINSTNSGLGLNYGGSCSYFYYGKSSIELTDASFKVTGGTNGEGITYYPNQISANFTKYSLVDKDYVTGLTSNIVTNGITSANNGLTKSGSNVRLGGALTGNTSITGNYTLNVNGGAKLNTTCGYQISGATILRTAPNSMTSLYIGCNVGGSSTALNNLGIGYQIMTGNTSGTLNVAIGIATLPKNIGNNNVAIGYNTMGCNLTGHTNIAIGSYAVYRNTVGNFNIGIGCGSLICNSISCDNIAVGNDAAYFVTGGCNVAFGSETMKGQSGCPNTGSRNVGVGYQALYCLSSGNNNVSIGYQAAPNVRTGCNNIAIGFQALASNQCGCNNIAIGYDAGHYETESGKFYVACIGTRNLIYGDFVTNVITIPKLCICDTPATGVCTDAVLIWNSTDKCVKQISSATLIGAGILTANNGLTKSGTNVRLGGALTGATVITLASDTCPLTFTDTATTKKGVVYSSTDTSGFANESLVTKRYVTGLTTTSGIQTACNGLTKTGTNVTLGGTLVQATTINGGNFALCLGATGNILGATNICGTSYLFCGTSTYTQYSTTSLSCTSSTYDVRSTGNAGFCSTGVVNVVGSCVNVTPTTNATIAAGTCVLGCVCTGAAAYSFVGVDIADGMLGSCGAGGSSTVIACNTGIPYVCGTAGVIVCTPNANGICLVGVVKLPTTPATGAAVTDSVLVWNSTDKIVKVVAGSTVGDKNNIYGKAVVTTSTGLTTNSPYLILVNHSAPVTLTLPVAPTDGQAFKIKDASATGGALTWNITIGRNGKNIDGAPSDALINTDDGAIEIVYDNSLGSWYTLAFIN